MTASNVTFSSAQNRERDQQLSAPWEKKLADAERKIHKLKYALDEKSKDLFDAVNRAQRLARSFGFKDEYEAQHFLDNADFDGTFQEILSRIQTLEVELHCEKQSVEILKAKLNAAEANNQGGEDVEMLRNELRASKDEIDRLNHRYDQLQDVKERAAERYKADYKKWHAVHKWLFSEDGEHEKHRNEPGISKEEKKRRDKASIMRKRQKMIELGPDMARIASELEDGLDVSVAGPMPGGSKPDGDKENEGTPSSRASSKKDNPSTSSNASHRSAVNGLSMLKAVTNIETPSASPSVFFAAGDPVATPPPLTIHAVSQSIIPKQESQSPSLARSFKRSYARMPSSSDTEDDSQAVCLPAPNTRSGNAVVFKIPAAPATTSRVNESRDRLPSSLPLRPLPASEPRRKLHFLCAEPMRSEERPSKIRRVSGDPFSVPQHSSVSGKPESSMHATPSTSSKSKTKERENDLTPVAAKTSTQTRTDYSSFKGRGRYGHNTQNTEKTINALYAINSAHNAGMNYQYDEVVRTRDARKKMHGGDCECCRDYYENVGPLPRRLQQPLWRSPTKSPAKSKSDRGRSLSPSPRERGKGGLEVESHRKAISRHRHTWARAKTPPGYWDIGFPDTQQVGDINQRAKEMQQRKLDEVEREAERDGGKFRKRH